MTESRIDATIVILESGDFYDVKLKAIPAVGDLINLFSFRNVSPKLIYYPNKKLEVVKVMHNISDAVKGKEDDLELCFGHSVIIFTRPSTSEYFQPPK